LDVSAELDSKVSDSVNLIEAAAAVAGIRHNVLPEAAVNQQDSPLITSPPQKRPHANVPQVPVGSGFVSIPGLGAVPSLSIEHPPMDFAAGWLLQDPSVVKSDTPISHSGVNGGENAGGIQVIYLPHEKRYYYQKTSEGVCTSKWILFIFFSQKFVYF
jgi:hypothetical protein